MKATADRNFRLLLLLALLVVATSWAIAIAHSVSVKNDTLARAAREVETTAASYATHTEMALAVADETLLRLRETAIHNGDAGFRAVAQTISAPAAIGGMNRAGLVNLNGRTRAIFLDGREASPVDVSDRAYFRALLADPTDRLIISEPLQGKLNGEWVILFARPLLKANKLDGVIFVAARVNRLGHHLPGITRPGMIYTVLSPENRILAHSVNAETLIGEQVVLPPEMQGNVDAIDFGSPLDGVTRLSAIRRVPDWGLGIYTGIDRTVLDGEISEHTNAAILPATLLTIVIAGAVLAVRLSQVRRLAAEQARDAEAQRSHSLLQSMTEGVLLVNGDGTVDFANAAADTWLNAPLGKPVDQALATADTGLVTEDGGPFAIADPVSYLCLQSGLPLEDAWLHCAKGTLPKEERWLGVRAHPLSEEPGRISGAIVTLTDRTDEHDRMADAEMAKTVLTSMNDAVMITDPKGRILAVNPAFRRMTGYALDSEVLGQTPALLRSSRQDAAFWAGMWKTLNEHNHWSGRVWNCRKDGSEYCVWHTITGVRDLRGRLVRYVAVSRDITDQEAQERDLWRRANFDPLTGLANRVRFEDRLNQALSHAQRHKHDFAVCYLDLDRFKPVNDQYGHAAGDALLRHVAERMSAVMRQEDTLARIGGDEFALLIPRIESPEAVFSVAEKIIGTINNPFSLDEGTVQIGVSIGIALYPQHGEEADALLANADAALYRAKADGRNVRRVYQAAGS